MKISIKGLDKAVVLQALHSRSKAQGMGFLDYDPQGLSVEQCRERLEHSSWVDYLQGRVIKVDFSTEDLDSFGYDRDNGQGALALVIAKLKSNSESS